MTGKGILKGFKIPEGSYHQTCAILDCNEPAAMLLIMRNRHTEMKYEIKVGRGTHIVQQPPTVTVSICASCAREIFEATQK